jgi:hypothetical protein
MSQLEQELEYPPEGPHRGAALLVWGCARNIRHCLTFKRHPPKGAYREEAPSLCRVWEGVQSDSPPQTHQRVHHIEKGFWNGAAHMQEPPRVGGMPGCGHSVYSMDREQRDEASVSVYTKKSTDDKWAG